MYYFDSLLKQKQPMLPLTSNLNPSYGKPTEPNFDHFTIHTAVEDAEGLSHKVKIDIEGFRYNGEFGITVCRVFGVDPKGTAKEDLSESIREIVYLHERRARFETSVTFTA